MTDKAMLDGLVQALMQARRDKQPAEAAAWIDVIGDDAARAYAVQQGVADALHWFDGAAGAGGNDTGGGRPMPRFWKSGGGSRTGPITHAPLPPEGVRPSLTNLGDMHFNAPRVETEIALRLARDVTPEQAVLLRHEDVDAFVDAMTVSIEIVDSRWREGQAAPALLKLADLQSHGALVLGDWVPYRPGHDWAAQRCETRIGNADPIERTGAHPLGEPAWLLPIWLQHLTRDGGTVPAGTVVTTGSWIGMPPTASGQRVYAEFAGIGRVELTV
ncbi:MAG: fumarylacetoacetate hydrolase family protein [Burkholderiales bacterium]